MLYNNSHNLFAEYPKGPCFHCEERTMSCDKTCQKFADYKSKLEKYKQQEHEYKLNRKDHIR